MDEIDRMLGRHLRDIAPGSQEERDLERYYARMLELQRIAPGEIAARAAALEEGA